MLCGAVFPSAMALQAQTPLEHFLSKAHDNVFTAALHAEAAARIAETHSNNNLENPEAEYAYMPGIEDTDGKRMSYGISQRIDWPGEYIARAKYNNLERQQATAEYGAERREFMLRLKLLSYEIIHAQKSQQLLDRQYNNAKQVYELTQKRLDVGEATSLDLNNARINLTTANTARLQGLSQIETKRQQLALLAGFNDFDSTRFDYLENPDMDIDSIQATALQQDAQIQVAQLDNEKSVQNVVVTRRSALPSFSIGVGGERITATDSFLGVTAGIAIPLWGGKGTVQTAKAQQRAAELRAHTIQTEVELSFTEQVNTIHQLRESLAQYGSLRDVHEGTELLNKSFELKNVSVLEYFTNLAFFNQIEQEYLDLELKLNQALAELTKYRL